MAVSVTGPRAVNELDGPVIPGTLSIDSESNPKRGSLCSKRIMFSFELSIGLILLPCLISSPFYNNIHNPHPR